MKQISIFLALGLCLASCNRNGGGQSFGSGSASFQTQTEQVQESRPDNSKRIEALQSQRTDLAMEVNQLKRDISSAERELDILSEKRDDTEEFRLFRSGRKKEAQLNNIDGERLRIMDSKAAMEERLQQANLQIEGIDEELNRLR